MDVSSVIDYLSPVITGAVLYLTNGSQTATIRFRDHGTATWYAMDTTVTLKYPYSGANTAIALLSDTHFGVGGGYDPSACLTTAIDDIDDNIGGIDYVFVLGDICHEADHYDTYKTVRATSDIAAANWRETAGNHDFAVLATFIAKLGPAYHSLTIGNAHFVFLSPDADTETMSAAQQTWLSGQLSSNGGKNVFILSHQGRWSTTRYTTHVTGYLRPVAFIDSTINPPLFTAWICGHSHGYLAFAEPDATRVYRT